MPRPGARPTEAVEEMVEVESEEEEEERLHFLGDAWLIVAEDVKSSLSIHPLPQHHLV